MSHRRAVLATAVLLSGVMAGCASQTPVPDPTPNDVTATVTSSATESLVPTPSPSQLTLPTPREDAISRSTVTSEVAESTSLDVAEKGVTYDVVAACDGLVNDEMRYTLVIDDVEAGGGTFSCGAHIRNTAFEAKGGETVFIRLEVLQPPTDAAFSSLAEVVPA